MSMKRRNVLKGGIAGMTGGLAGAFLMSQVHSGAQKILSLPPPEGEDSTVRTASAISRLLLHKELTRSEKEKAGPIVHYAFGASVGSVYGAAAELAPVVSTGWGTLLGIAVWRGAHVIAVPALGLSEPMTRSPAGAEAAELAAHLAYGSVVETVRRLLRR
jgi:putative membrane protein